ncbi:MAG: CcmD family protein [Actinomycetota bacterium]
MHWEFVIAGYVIVFTGLGAYAAYLINRGKQLTKRVPESRRRFLD